MYFVRSLSLLLLGALLAGLLVLSPATAHAWWFHDDDKAKDAKTAEQEAAPGQTESLQEEVNQEEIEAQLEAQHTRPDRQPCEVLRQKIVALHKKAEGRMYTFYRPKLFVLRKEHRKCLADVMGDEMLFLKHARVKTKSLPPLYDQANPTQPGTEPDKTETPATTRTTSDDTPASVPDAGTP